ncbi:MAG: DNA repair protein RadC [Bacteroidota bacterium]
MEHTKRIPISEWKDSDKPREKMISNGKNSLSDAELIAILMGSGNSKESAVDLAQRILSDNQNNLIELSRKSISDLTIYTGVGEAKAISILAALELGQRRRQAEVIERKQVKSSSDVFEYMSVYLSDLTHESFWVILLNRANNIITQKSVSEGGTTSTVVDIKMIAKYAIDNHATGVILAHNHPSGNTQPSEQDNKLTDKIKNALNIFDITLLDHIIVCSTKYYSYADEGNI